MGHCMGTTRYGSSTHLVIDSYYFIYHSRVCIVLSINQKAISDSFYDSQGFGLDKAYSGCLLYLDTNQGLIYLSTAGSLVALLEDEDTSQKLLDEINPSIKTGEFKEAVYLTLQFLTEYKTSL